MEGQICGVHFCGEMSKNAGKDVWTSPADKQFR